MTNQLLYIHIKQYSPCHWQSLYDRESVTELAQDQTQDTQLIAADEKLVRVFYCILMLFVGFHITFEYSGKKFPITCTRQFILHVLSCIPEAILTT
uniref:Uncharacterized protein n=1 Tax=Falco tinnunculus TaxID=100819 RepID=A0A8C4UTD8_FALTI